MAFYAVARGRKTGVFNTWAECNEHVRGYENARFKKFTSKLEAQQFVDGNGSLILGQMGILDVDPGPTGPLRSPRDAEKEKTHEPDDLVCFSDGSCLNNGKLTAKAGYSCVFPNHPHLTCNFKLHSTPQYPVTNNRAEFSALIKALEICASEDPQHRKRLYFYTDSRLLIDSATKWIPSWKKKGWRKSDGEDVLNKDLVIRIDELLNNGSRKVVFKHVAAHTRGTDWASVWNEKADVLAKEAAE